MVREHRLMGSTGLVLALGYATLTCQLPATGITAHRGASHDAPENTLSAFRLAWERGADAIEGDFYLTTDGHVVCIHDKTTKRTAGEDRNVAQSTLAELRALDVGRWKGAQWAGERIPTIEEVLATVPAPEKRVYIELKAGPAIVAPVKKALDASGLRPSQVVIISFDKAAVTEAKRAMPEIMVCWLSSFKKRDDGKFTPTAADVARVVRATGADGVGVSAKAEVVTAAFLHVIRQGGVKDLHVWTVNDPEAAARFAALGVNGITTDRPALIRARLAKEATRSAQ